MEVKMTSDYKDFPAINLLLYGEAKTGKSTFGTTAKNGLVADAESGYRYMGSKGINVAVAEIKIWEDMQEFYKEASKPEYDTVVIDPVNEILEKLLRKAKTNALYTQSTDKNALSMKGWGFVKDKMREMLKTFRDLNKNVIFIAHTKTQEDDGSIKKIPKLDANLSGELMAMMDVIGYMAIINADGEQKRVIAFKPSAKYDAGDRTGILPEYFDPSKGFETLKELVYNNPRWQKKVEIEKSMKESEDKFFADMKPSEAQSEATPDLSD